MVKPYIHVDVCLYRCLNMSIRGERRRDCLDQSAERWLEKGYRRLSLAGLVASEGSGAAFGCLSL